MNTLHDLNITFRKQLDVFNERIAIIDNTLENQKIILLKPFNTIKKAYRILSQNTNQVCSDDNQSYY